MVSEPKAGDMTILHGDCREVMAGMDAESVDAVVCDPPYLLNFMGKEWDGQGTHLNPKGMQAWHESWAIEAFRVLKPGAHLLAFGGTRTSHRLASALEDTGFEIRDGLVWIYGQGFPKSLNVERAIAVKTCKLPGRHFAATLPVEDKRLPEDHICPMTPESEPWDGWGTAAKPAHEPIVVARKPLAGAVWETVMAHGTGALNVDGCRVGYQGEADKASATPQGIVTSKNSGAIGAEPDAGRNMSRVEFDRPEQAGRWPANVLLSHHPDCNGTCHEDCPVAALDRQSGETSVTGKRRDRDKFGFASQLPLSGRTNRKQTEYPGDTGGASRFFATFAQLPIDDLDFPAFYCAKASRRERNAGLDGMPEKMLRWSAGDQNPGPFQSEGTNKHAQNLHPTVKPVALLRWLIRLVTPPNGLVLDPFAGSGSAGIAAHLEGVGYVGIEQDAEYVTIAERRISWVERHGERWLEAAKAPSAGQTAGCYGTETEEGAATPCRRPRHRLDAKPPAYEALPLFAAVATVGEA